MPLCFCVRSPWEDGVWWERFPAAGAEGKEKSASFQFVSQN